MATYTVISPDGRTFEIQGDSPPSAEVIRSLIQRNDTISAVNRDISPLDAFRVGAGRAMTNLARGVGLAEEENPIVGETFENLRQQRPISTTAGEITGYAAPFVGPGMGVGAIANYGGRVLASTVLGALEGALISRGEGGDVGETITGGGVGGVVAGTIEAAYPILGRIARNIVTKVRGKPPAGALFNSAGKPTEELQSALKAVGVTLDDLAEDAVFVLKQVEEGVNPEEAIRLSRFESLDLPSTKGDISQDFAQQAEEERLVSMASAEAGEPLRQLRLDQSEAFQQGVNDFVDALGVPQETGDQVKLALSGRLDNLKSRKNELYKQVAESSNQLAYAPLFTDGIADALPAPANLRRMSRIKGNDIPAIQDLLVEFGIDQSPEAVERFVKSGGEVIPLNLSNFDEFRQALNQLSGGQSPGERVTTMVAKDIINALDDEVSNLEKVLLDTNVTDAGILDSLREARSIVAQTKTEFSPQSITGRLIGKKPDNYSPLIESSKVYDAILNTRTPPEYLQRTVAQLLEAGPEGQRALGNLQATAVMRALDDALKAPFRKTSGTQTIGYTQFVKSLEKIGDERLDVLFQNNPEALKRLKQFKGAAEDITPTAGATPRGSAAVILDALNRFGRTPGIAAVVDLVKFVINAGDDDRAVMRALKNRPDAAMTIQQEYPAIASALGIAGINVLQEEEQ